MTRREFLEHMLADVFEVKYIEYHKEIGNTIYYQSGGTLCKDCTYSQKYKNKFRTFWEVLLSDKYETIVIEKGGSNVKNSIKEYQEKARDYVFRFSSLRDEPDSDKLKEVITLSMVRQIYLNIILETLFNIGEMKANNERGKDNFDKLEAEIKKEVDSFIIEKWTTLKGSMYKNSYFSMLVEQYPVFAELQLNENEETIVEDIKEIWEYIRVSKRIYPIMIYPDLSGTFALMDKARQCSVSIATYCDKSDMRSVHFEFLTDNLNDLCACSEKYIDIFTKEDVEQFKNTAVRAYNHFYGRKHPEYTGRTFHAYWDAHRPFIEYLFMLDLVLKAYDKLEKAHSDTE